LEYYTLDLCNDICDKFLPQQPKRPDGYVAKPYGEKPGSEDMLFIKSVVEHSKMVQAVCVAVEEALCVQVEAIQSLQMLHSKALEKLLRLQRVPGVTRQLNPN
jgi:hypothetical protein